MHNFSWLSFSQYYSMFCSLGSPQQQAVVCSLTMYDFSWLSLSVNITQCSVAWVHHSNKQSFAGIFSEKVTRTVRQFSPHLAAKMRPPLRPVIRGRPSSKRAIYICGQPRWVFVLVFSTVSFILWFVSCALLTVLLALAIGLLATIAHASFRVPNLKARLNTFREEFRTVWRNYSEL
ncbi:PRA1 family protein A1-like isoform X2 [Olea europaea var. sylvestris]|uniref:PRA1 family protein A1-like isoform X2 n=1 Tax=Olea europaea var. sylvestris TaxID=158386 RepID=UPI000C1CE4F4|nr:PRA1 family protein A1-like isoform X2 [Olea europaea var. sylvestris]XP_022870926.1 PRA1 family protein A1-like isoform X2 [Olea europaea var. sylvestris]